MFRRLTPSADLPGFFSRFGAKGARHVAGTLREIAAHKVTGTRFALDATTAGFVRPDLAWPAYAGLVPSDGLSPIYHFFDRTNGGRAFSGKITRGAARDYRGGQLTYDEHDGTDFVCPAGTQVVASAPGVLVAVRDRFLRGGLTACVDHGGVVTQYTHLAKVTAEIGQPLLRGEALGLSGHAGFDMIIGFPWVPPHVHFMAWVLGQPVDPYVRPDEDEHAATWIARNDPLPAAGPIEGDPKPIAIDDVQVDRAAIERVTRMCTDRTIAREIEAAPHFATRAALIEDSLHHDRHVWPDAAQRIDLRPHGARDRVRLSLPLTASEYRGSRVSDAPWTRPARRSGS